MNKTSKKISLNDIKNRYLVLDTETIHSGLMENNDLKQIRDIIEISWKALNCDGVEILGSRKGFIVKEFWENRDYLFSTNYTYNKKQKTIEESENFAVRKIDYWKQEIENGHLKVLSWGAIMQQLAKDIKTYDITLFSAYNAKFDRCAIVDTSKAIPYRTFCKGLWDLDCLDIMKIVEIFAKQKDFKKWADNHGAISDSGNYQSKAETIYRYLVNNNADIQTIAPDSYNWAESHIALEDIDCEAVILQTAITLSRRKREIKVPVNEYGNWQTFNKLVKESAKPKAKSKKQLSLDLETIKG